MPEAVNSGPDGRRIAVAIPAYNAAATLRRALVSVEGQRRRPDEVIVVDDGSTDATLALARDFAASSALRITVVEQANAGASAARNAAVTATGAELIGFLDADDEYKPWAVEQLAEMHAAFPDAVLAFGDSERVEGEAMKNESFLKPRLDGSGDIQPCGRFNLLRHTFRNIVAGTFVTAGSYMVTRSGYLAIGGFDTSLERAVDRDFFMRLAGTGPWVFTWEVLARIHYTPGSLNHLQNAGAHAENALDILCRYRRSHPALGGGDWRSFQRALIRTARAVFYWAGLENPAAIAAARARFPDLRSRPDIAALARLEMLRSALRAIRDQRPLALRP